MEQQTCVSAPGSGCHTGTGVDTQVNPYEYARWAVGADLRVPRQGYVSALGSGCTQAGVDTQVNPYGMCRLGGRGAPLAELVEAH